MWKPVGPLPASVYWRRRGAALASVVVVVTALGWGLGELRTAPDRDVAVAAGRVAATAASLTEASGAELPGFALVGSLAGSLATPEGEPSETPTTTAERLRPDDTPRASVPVPDPEPVPETGPVPCTNDMLTVTAEIDAPEHRVGQRPELRLVVVNHTGAPCVRDLDAQRQEIVVWSEDVTDRLWSSNDCVNAPSTDLRTLVPGRPVAFSVRWLGRTTEPGCPQQRSTVPAGSYQLLTRVDDLISEPTPFTRLP